MKRLTSRQQTVSAVLSELEGVSSKQIEAAFVSSLQTVVSKNLTLKLNSFVKDMRAQVSGFIEELERKNELDSVVQSIESLKQEIEGLKGTMSTLSFAPCESELTERDVDCFVQEKRINELIIQICKKQNQGILLYALDQMENDVLYEIDAGLLMSVAYCVVFVVGVSVGRLCAICRKKRRSELSIFIRL